MGKRRSSVTEDLLVPEVIIPTKKAEPPGVRDGKGRFIKGHRNVGAGRPRKVKDLDKLIEKYTGENCENILRKLVDIAMYDPDEEVPVKDPSGKETFRKRGIHFYTSNVQLNAIQLLLGYYYGRPKEKVEMDKNVNVNIEQKVGIITKLITENKERLKLVEGGKE